MKYKVGEKVLLGRHTNGVWWNDTSMKPYIGKEAILRRYGTNRYGDGSEKIYWNVDIVGGEIYPNNQGGCGWYEENFFQCPCNTKLCLTHNKLRMLKQ